MIIPDNIRKIEYTSRVLAGMPRGDGFQRLDPSNVIFHSGKYYAYWTKAKAETNLYAGSVFCGSSDDGITWREESEVLTRSEGGEWDNFGVITPYVVPQKEGFYLFYTSSHKKKDEPWEVRGENNKRHIGVAFSENPRGPFRRIKGAPILSPSESGWDSYLVDDTHVMTVNGKYYLYYKGGDRNVTPHTTRWGLAVSDCVTGPYVKYGGNPVTDSGHTVCILRHRDGFVALFDDAGPNRHSAAFSSDGIVFETVKSLGHVDTGCGAFDPAAFGNAKAVPPEKIWGLTACADCPVPFLKRFELKNSAGNR